MRPQDVKLNRVMRAMERAMKRNRDPRKVDEYASLTQEEKTQLKELLKPKSSNGPASPPNESIESNADEEAQDEEDQSPVNCSEATSHVQQHRLPGFFDNHINSILHRTASHHQRGFRGTFGDSDKQKEKPKESNTNNTQLVPRDKVQSNSAPPDTGGSSLFQLPRVPIKLTSKHEELAELDVDADSDSEGEKDFLKVVNSPPGTRVPRKGAKPRQKKSRRYYLKDECLEPRYYADLESQDIPDDVKEEVKRTYFIPEIRSMMHGFADSCHPRYDCARYLHEETKAWIYDVVGDIRRILGKKKITMPDFLKVMPDHLKLFFRWKHMRRMADAQVGGSQKSIPKAAVNGIATLPVKTEETELGSDDDDDNDGEDDPEDDDDDEDKDDEIALLEAEANETAGDRDWLENITNKTAAEHFKERIAFANRRTKLMTSTQYWEYSRAREAYFLAHKELIDKFKSWIPDPPVGKNTLRLLAYLCYDRVGTIAETANRIVYAGRLVEPEDPLPYNAYYSAVASLPARPEELKTQLDYAESKRALIEDRKAKVAEKPQRIAAHAEMLKDAKKGFREKRKRIAESDRSEDDTTIASSFAQNPRPKAMKSPPNRLHGIRSSGGAIHITPAKRRKFRQ